MKPKSEREPLRAHRRRPPACIGSVKLPPNPRTLLVFRVYET